ncbi:MAG: OmpA family protein [Brachymonas sp.]|nr:OmpA family protein [Brachymonas sp.]
MAGEDNNQRENVVVAAIVLLAILIALSVSMCAGIRTVRKANAGKGSPVAAASGVVGQTASAGASVGAGAAQAQADEARIEVVDGVVQFYFASGKAEIAKGAKEALAEAVAAAKAGKKLIISGYHDSTGSAELNAELAKQRAFSVRDALLAEGVAESSMDLKKPEFMPQTDGADARARRVDVAIE